MIPRHQLAQTAVNAAMSDEEINRLKAVCTSDEYIAQVEAKQAEFKSRLEAIMQSDVPQRVKIARIRLVTVEIVTLKIEIMKAVIALKNQQPT